MHIKIFSIISYGGHFVPWRAMVWSILVEGFIRDICVKIILNLGHRGCHLRFFFFLLDLGTVCLA